jgi:hypothetical protein
MIRNGIRIEESIVLEGAADAEPSGAQRTNTFDALAIEEHLAGIGAIDAIDDIEKRALACPVGSDERAYLSLRDIETQFVERLDALERKRHVAQLQDRFGHDDQASAVSSDADSRDAASRRLTASMSRN